MADLLRRPAVIALLAAVVAVVVVVVLVLTAGDDEITGSPDAGPTATDPGTGTVTEPSPTRASPEEFCEAFRAFADAANSYVVSADDLTGPALVEAGQRLAALDPLGLSPGGQVSLDELVNGSLDPLDVSVGLANDGPPDQAAFDAYLESSCPA